MDYDHNWKAFIMIPHSSEYMYHVLEMNRAAISPLNLMAKSMQNFSGSPFNPLSYTELGRTIGAGFEMFERITHTYKKPEFGINHTKIGTETVAVTEKIITERPYCNLLHFEKKTKARQQKLLIVAPMSGHYATLLRGTVEATLPFYDVYITDWQNARDVPVSAGKFDLDDYVAYVIKFTQQLGPDVHLMAVCQPSVPVMGAVALMSAAKDPATPRSMILIGGPIDTRRNPTKVNHFAEYRPIEWFERHVISRVPFNYPGFMRRVYPGFIQLTGFMSMNLDRHMGEHFNLFLNLVRGDGESATSHKKFYNEYLSVMDLPAEFYLQTLQVVFKDHALPRGKWQCLGKTVDPNAITKTGILAIEGELDDISGIGQTKAALKITKNLPESKKHYHMQKAVGHYGSFNGRKFRDHIMPVIRKFTESQA